MAKTIWKFPIVVADSVQISMPQGARVLSVQEQNRTPCIWALVDPEAPKQTRRFRILGTGHDFPEADAYEYHDTFQMHGGALVFHLFERRERG